MNTLDSTHTLTYADKQSDQQSQEGPWFTSGHLNKYTVTLNF